jgi:ABC-type glycerol-3-phosphate transport system permease component
VSFAFLFLLGIVWITPVLWLILNSFKYDSDFITSFANLTGPWIT